MFNAAEPPDRADCVWRTCKLLYSLSNFSFQLEEEAFQQNQA